MGSQAVPVRIREADTPSLRAAEVRAIRALLEAAFDRGEDDRFTDDDWAHACGGRHFVVEAGNRIVGHASVIERELHLAGRPIRTGYVEAVAVEPARQATGIGSVLMARVNTHIRERFELGALSTGRRRFYERLGWRTWLGPSSVRTADGEQRTPDEDGYILVLETPATPIRPLDMNAPISCDWRPGDVW